jgi:hypothetical protein
MRRTLSLLLLATAVVGCGSKTPEPAKVPLDQAPAASPATSAAAAPAASDLLTGKVLEHQDAAPYLYLRIATAKGEVWAAVPEAKIENGAEVTVFSPMLMTNFESKTLKRSFKEVYFGTLTPANTAADAPGANPHAGVAQPSAPVEVGKVEKATGADARTVAEAWAQKASLAGKTITIHGKVVKFNGGVMGKNWLHLRDGSGDAGKGTNDITVTSMDEAAVGLTVTIKGTVRTNQDFGSGYSYAIIVEKAKIVRDVKN